MKGVENVGICIAFLLPNIEAIDKFHCSIIQCLAIVRIAGRLVDELPVLSQQYQCILAIFILLSL